jgi:hypothetical protein
MFVVQEVIFQNVKKKVEKIFPRCCNRRRQVLRHKLSAGHKLSAPTVNTYNKPTSQAIGNKIDFGSKRLKTLNYLKNQGQN